MTEKNQEFELYIEDITDTGEGIGRYGGYPFFVSGAVPGDRIRARVTKQKKTYGYARIQQILVPSPSRVEPPCLLAGKCGGCQLQAMAYPAQLAFKEKRVRDCLTRIGGIADANVLPTLGMDTPFRYRNKAQVPAAAGQDGEIRMGYYRTHSHSIVDMADCLLGSRRQSRILGIIRRWMEEYRIRPYDEEKGAGLVRHILIRESADGHEILVCLVINGRKLPVFRELAGRLKDEAETVSLQVNCNTARTNVILGPETVCLYGPETIRDHIGENVYRISPGSFFQVNHRQTEVLYEQIRKAAGLTGRETVWDLYCGTGTIALYLAREAACVYGVESYAPAVKDAKSNAKENGLANVTFFAGKAEEAAAAGDIGADNRAFPDSGTTACIGTEDDRLCAGEGQTAPSRKEENIPLLPRPDVVVLDPPRKGCDPELIRMLGRILPERIVYVSCNPATLARDLQLLGEDYGLQWARPIDMFPQTAHVETVCLLSNRKPDSYVHLNLKMEDYYRIKDAQKEQDKK